MWGIHKQALEKNKNKFGSEMKNQPLQNIKQIFYVVSESKITQK